MEICKDAAADSCVTVQDNFPRLYFVAYYHTQSPSAVYANLGWGGAKVPKMISPFQQYAGRSFRSFFFFFLLFWCGSAKHLFDRELWYVSKAGEKEILHLVKRFQHWQRGHLWAVFSDCFVWCDKNERITSPTLWLWSVFLNHFVQTRPYSERYYISVC